jgi:hypothetical protein
MIAHYIEEINLFKKLRMHRRSLAMTETSQKNQLVEDMICIKKRVSISLMRDR